MCGLTASKQVDYSCSRQSPGWGAGKGARMSTRHAVVFVSCLPPLLALLAAKPVAADVTERVSVASDGTQGDAGSDAPAISADGRFVAFHSFANNLVAGDTNGSLDVFVHDRQTGATERVSVDS